MMRRDVTAFVLGALISVLLMLVTGAKGQTNSETVIRIPAGRYVGPGGLVLEVGTMASATPLPTPTTTIAPSPTLTLSPVPTWTPSYTEAPDATPTPEVTALPPLTPGPLKTCEVKAQFNLRVRGRPSVNGTITGSIVANEVLVADAAQLAEGYLWLHHAKGWSAVRQGTTWWVYGIEGHSEVCADLPGWPDSLPPPPPVVQRTMFGLLVVPGVNMSELLRFGEILRSNGIQPMATVVQDATLANTLVARDWFVVFRPWSVWPGDCPDTSIAPDASARLRLAYVERQAQGARFNAVQISNECRWPDASYTAAWIIAVVDGCNARRWSCIPIVWNTGAPELDWLPVLRPALAAMRANRHYWGMNLYPYYPVKLVTRTPDTQYTTYRYELLQAAMPDLPTILVTEAAESGGGEPPDVSDMAAFAYSVDGRLAGVCFWYAGGPLAAWPRASLNGHMMALAERLVGNRPDAMPEESMK